MQKLTRRRAGERGVALILVLILLTVLTAMGYMALYTASIERDLDRSYRYRLSMRDTVEGCVHAVTNQVLRSGGLKLSPWPSAENTGWALGQTQRHPVIGVCTVVSPKCGNPFLEINGNKTDGSVSDMCCCRTGPLLNQSGNILYQDDFLANRAILSIQRINGGAIPGEEANFVLYPFSIAAGGPARSIAESKVVIKYGPVPRADSSGEKDVVGM
jgi:hypothetical protein